MIAIVAKTDGLSNAEIKDIMLAMHKKSLATQSGLPTMVIIDSAIAEGIEKKQALKEDKAKREAHHKTVALSALAA